MKKTLCLLFTLTCIGCADVAPKADSLVKMQSKITADVKAGVVTEFKNLIGDVNTRLDAKLNNDMKDVKAGIITELQNRVDMNIRGIEAGIITKINTRLDNKVAVTGQRIDSRMKALEATLNTSVDQRFKQSIGEMKGEMNIGPFSGGGFYLTVVSVVLLVTMFVFLGFLISRLLRWKNAFHGLTRVIEEHGQNGHSDTIKAVKSSFRKNMDKQGMTNFVNNELKKIGVM